ncbi:MAG: hypothetical protein WB565_12005 [Acidimicrobiales bacterium]
MPLLTWIANHRFWVVGMGVALLIVAVATGVWVFFLRSPGTQLDLRQALRLYRQSERTADGANAELPPSGVYRYRTTGNEKLSIAGIARSFPNTTNAIVTVARCATVRWEPLVEHVEGQVECPVAAGGLSLVSLPSSEQIAGITTNMDIDCPAGTYLVPPNAAVGKRWKATCHAPAQVVQLSGSVVGFSSVKVDGTSVPSVHTRLSMSFSGAESGTSPSDYWVSLENGMILRESESVDVQQSAGPLGSVHYTEEMAISLQSLTPVR